MRYLSAKPTAKNTAPNVRGFVMYEGKSELTGEPIAVIATLVSKNAKTGDMIQTWIIRADMDPLDAVKEKKDAAICGNCVHRRSTGGACYVEIGKAPKQVYKAYKAGKYPIFNYDDHAHYFAGRKIRLGAYGDPAAAPFGVMRSIADLGTGWTGYTHQAGRKGFDPRFMELCQVSADSPKQAEKFQALGAKTFRVAMAGDALADNEIECLSDSKGLNCLDCMLCDGTTKNIAITVHGSQASKFKTQMITAINIQ
jgi:hypothetical protein